MEGSEARDYRRTLYWNPNVRVKADGSASVEFYNNSAAAALSISAACVTSDGKIGALTRNTSE